jgi:PAS domain S-box-containing protein
MLGVDSRIGQRMTAPQPDDSSLGGGSHAVHFYEHDEELATRVAAYIGEALLAGEPAVIIASPPHRQQFIAHLAAMNVDVEGERTAGNLTILDAAATLGKFMVASSPDRELFRRVVGGLMESIATRGNRSVKVRAYGEMVDVLWQEANQSGAIALEEMWTDLGAVYSFDLLCAYAMAAFAAGPAGAEVRAVCGEHSHVTVAAPSDAQSAGSSVPVDDSIQPSRDLASEIARRKQVETALRRSVRELTRAQAAERERAAQAQQLADDLRETIRVNELFVGVLAHDLRAPLTAIMTAGELIRKREVASPDGRNAKTLTRLLASGERMSRMVEQLLDFTRLRVGGGFAIEPRETDMAVLVQQVVDELDGSYPDCAVDIRPVGDTHGSWDADRLCQVISNLVANAFQHGVPAAGIRVLIDGSAADLVRVQVHNMGGIPPALMSQIFAPLTGGQRRRDRSRGLGLGLFITQRIADSHGGAVTVSSNEAEGTTFTLSLPRVANGVMPQASLTNGVALAPPENINLAALAQDQLRESQTRFQLLVEAVKDYAIFMLDPSGRVVTWNAGAERIKGYAAREILGHHFSEFYDDEEVRSGKCERELEGAARDGRFEDEGWRVRKDGTKFWANVVITALRTENGELVGYAKVTRDLTERRRLEEERVSLARAAEAIRLRDEFLSLAAHELKTPLTVLQLQLDTLNDRMDDSGQRVAKKLQRAAQSGERLALLVESLLDVSRIATGRFALDIKEFDLIDSIHRIVDGLRPSAERARCEMSIVSAAPIVGAWDRLRLEQALTNLLANAIKYGAGAPVIVSAGRHGNAVVLEVRDHGPGIPEGELARIFQRFERAASIRNYGGLGLGLYFIQAIVDAHGGSVTAANASDGGALFQITLPLRTTIEAADGDLQQPADVN